MLFETGWVTVNFAKIFIAMRAILSSLLIAVMLISCSTNNVETDNSLKKYFDENKWRDAFL